MKKLLRYTLDIIEFAVVAVVAWRVWEFVVDAVGWWKLEREMREWNKTNKMTTEIMTGRPASTG